MSVRPAEDFETARAELRRAERDLMLQRERVAAMRRSLPAGPIVEDYHFIGPDGPQQLSELFTAPDRPLVTYHFMFGGNQVDPCPMCSMWVDAWSAVARHLQQRIDFVMVSSAPIDQTIALANERGWEDLRWVSASGNTFKRDVGGEDETGNQLPFISAWELDDGRPRLTYSGSAHITEEHWRGVDLLSPVWHVLDLTRAGRGEWFPALEYPAE